MNVELSKGLLYTISFFLFEGLRSLVKDLTKNIIYKNTKKIKICFYDIILHIINFEPIAC